MICLSWLDIRTDYVRAYSIPSETLPQSNENTSALRLIQRKDVKRNCRFCGRRKEKLYVLRNTVVGMAVVLIQLFSFPGSRSD